MDELVMNGAVICNKFEMLADMRKHPVQGGWFSGSFLHTNVCGDFRLGP